MSIGKLLTEQLRRVAGGDISALQRDDAGITLIVPHAVTPVVLSLADTDRYSVTMRELRVGSALPRGDSRAYLSATAAEIARRLSYLEEPLAVWELDGGERIAQLRSSPPLREGEELSYWEVTLAAGESPGAAITRYRWAPNFPERELVAYPATFALLARMADSLAEALRSAAE